MSRRTGRPSYLVPPPTPRPRQRRIALAGGVVALMLVAGLVGGWIGHAVSQPSQFDQRVAEIRQADARRDVQQIIELTEVARKTREQLLPILRGIESDAAAGRAPDGTRARQWQQTMRQLTEQFAHPPSGSTATNVARGGLKSAVEQAAVAVDAAALAAGSPAAARTDLMALVRRQASLAATTWSVAAAQLDQINVDAGQGHQHVYLETDQAEGALAPDGAPEGSGR
ncbi:hypothetical protein [Micromonospora zhanjiangensis]|uniref:Uncharacterized protein n=1 Tax=Micromonospora zhanjiangensis TaxID=1522057 RepID=A0ABV8KHZ9_9ACTN